MGCGSWRCWLRSMRMPGTNSGTSYGYALTNAHSPRTPECLFRTALAMRASSSALFGAGAGAGAEEPSAANFFFLFNLHRALLVKVAWKRKKEKENKFSFAVECSSRISAMKGKMAFGSRDGWLVGYWARERRDGPRGVVDPILMVISFRQSDYSYSYSSLLATGTTAE